MICIYIYMYIHIYVQFIYRNIWLVNNLDIDSRCQETGSQEYHVMGVLIAILHDRSWPRGFECFERSRGLGRVFGEDFGNQGPGR